MTTPMDKPKTRSPSYLPPLFAGALAGISVDVALYPLDTLKTRLQSEQGFYKAGGFKGVYRGVLTVATGSMPTTALFFMSYEATKTLVQPHVDKEYAPLVHMLAASVGEVLACVIRVPTEIAKQRKQTHVGTRVRSSIAILTEAYKTEGFRRGLYRGFLSTVARDLPFSFLELPAWELMKTAVRDRNDGQITSLQSAACGSLAGALAAGLTTPLDVAKTRVMLAPTARSLPAVLQAVYAHAGVRGLFAGATPRVWAFALGGFVFFGVYERATQLLTDHLDR